MNQLSIHNLTPEQYEDLQLDEHTAGGSGIPTHWKELKTPTLTLVLFAPRGIHEHRAQRERDQHHSDHKWRDYGPIGVVCRDCGAEAPPDIAQQILGVNVLEKAVPVTIIDADGVHEGVLDGNTVRRKATDEEREEWKG